MNNAAGGRGAASKVVPPHLPGHKFVELIDSGGFAEVFRYRRELLDWDVAVKVLRAGHSGLPGQDFINEARIMAELAWHPNIMTIHDHGTVADGRPYLVMDYCAPPNLKERSRGGRMPVQEVLEVGILIAGAVETAHRAGYLHRDIKPANILVNAGGEPVLADFGISSAILVPDTERDALSLPWAALEVVRGERAGPAADVHSLGATIYTLLAGRAPFHREGAPNSWHDTLLRQQSEGPEPVGRNDLPAGLEDLLRRSMSSDPAKRPRSALQFAHQLAGFGPAAWRAPEPRLGRHSTPMIHQFTPEDVGGAAESGERGGVGEVAESSSETTQRRAGATSTAPEGQPDRATQRESRDQEALHEAIFGAESSWESRFPGDVPADGDTLVRSPRGGGSRSRRARGLVAGVALVASIAALLIFRPWGSDEAPCQDPGDFDPSCSAESVEEPGVPESAIDPGLPDPPSALTWKRKRKAAVLSWEVKDAQVGDRYVWWLEGEGLDQERRDTAATSVTIPGVGEKAGCAVVSVTRQGRTSEASRKCFGAGG